MKTHCAAPCAGGLAEVEKETLQLENLQLRGALRKLAEQCHAQDLAAYYEDLLADLQKQAPQPSTAVHTLASGDGHCG